jgi:hypothetical protein
MTLFVGRIGPILFFVIVPAVLIVIGAIWFRNTSYELFRNQDKVSFLFFFLNGIPLAYTSWRVDHIEEYLKKGVEQVIDEFETLKKILIVELPIFSIVIALNVIVSAIAISMGRPSLPPDFSTFFNITFRLTSTIMMAVIAGLIMYGENVSKKEFRFYNSKICFSIALTKEDIFKQMYYFNLGLQEYNNYLKRHLKHQIKDIDKFFSKVSLLDNNTKKEVICSLSESFKTENDKLKPMKYISSQVMKSEDIESFLVPESLKSQLKVVGTFLVTSIPIAISIITLISRFFKI